MEGQSGFTRTIVLATVGLAILLVVAALTMNVGQQLVDSRAEALTLDALPSIEHLIAAVDALRDLQANADDFPDLPDEMRPAARATLDADWKRMEAELTAYRALPAFAGEEDLYESTVPPSLRVLSETEAQLFAAVDANDMAGARTLADPKVRFAADEMAAHLRALVRLNAGHAYEEVRGLGKTHLRVTWLEFLFGVAAIGMGLGATLLLLRQFRAHDKLAADHAAVVERRAEELEMFGQRVAHDLLSPLSALTYCLSAFKRASEADPKLADALRRARGCVARAQKMVDSIFEFARAGGRPQPGARADVRPVLEEVCEELAEAAQGDASAATVVVEPFEDCSVACGRGVLAIVASNLLSNAVKYTRDSAEKRIFVRVTPRAGSVQIEVEDHGPGVPDTVVGRIFEPYVRAEGVTQAGLGLGLATVKRLCEAHAGAVGVRSQPGRGSVFWVKLPVAPQGAAAEPPQSAVSLRQMG